METRSGAEVREHSGPSPTACKEAPGHGQSRAHLMGRQTIPAPLTCTLDGCDKPHCARGLCNTHYARARSSGALRAIKDIPNDERFDARWQLDPDTGCHVWMRGKDSSGYGVFPLSGGGDSVRAHVYAWTRANGPVPEGQVLDHYVCDNKSCCNPAHLRPANWLANLRRPRGGDYIDLGAPRPPGFCIRGHELTPESTYPARPGRRLGNCKACMRLRNIERGVKDREARHARGLLQHSSRPKKAR